MAESPGYKWEPEHEGVLAKLADTNEVLNPWSELKDMLKWKISEAIDELTGNVVPFDVPRIPETADPGEDMLALWLVIPPFPPRSANLPPVEYPLKVLAKDLSLEEANKRKEKLFDLMESFEDQPPFTIQRLTELALRPREHYNAVGKYIRAVERTLVVTSTWDEYRLDTYTSDDSQPLDGASLASNQALAHATTPLFSPIPFLHSRSRSQSPTSTVAASPLSLSLDGRGPLPGDDTTDSSSTVSSISDENIPPGGVGGMSSATIRTLRVDELDHVSPPSSPSALSVSGAPGSPGAASGSSSLLEVPSSLGADERPLSPSQRIGHLAEHPEPFSSTTVVPGPNTNIVRSSGLGVSLGASSDSLSKSKSPPPRSGAPSPPALGERFVRASTPEPSPTRALEEVKRQAIEGDDDLEPKNVGSSSMDEEATGAAVVEPSTKQEGDAAAEGDNEKLGEDVVMKDS